MRSRYDTWAILLKELKQGRSVTYRWANEQYPDVTRGNFNKAINMLRRMGYDINIVNYKGTKTYVLHWNQPIQES